MQYPIYTLSNNRNQFEYIEYPGDKDKGSFLSVYEDDDFISIVVDQFSTIPFYYNVHEGRLYGSTKLNLLLDSLPENYTRQINPEAAIAFIRTNSMLAEDTLLKGIMRIPMATKLLFNKKAGTTTLQPYWQLPGSVEHRDEKLLIEDLRESFLSIISPLTSKYDRIGMHLSGGMDSRQILAALLHLNVNIETFTYGTNANLDVDTAERLVKKFNLKHNFFSWDGANGFKDNADLHFKLTDGMQALFHGHGVGIHEEESRRVDTIIYGHFLDFFMQGHTYNDFFEKDAGLYTNAKLYELFDGGPFSAMRGDSVEPFMLKKEWRGLFKERVFKEIEKFDYMTPEKRYDALYFYHHGLRRLMPQVQSGAQHLDFRLPGLDRDFFKLAWSVSGGMRKDRELQRKLILALSSEALKISVVKDNISMRYMGENSLLKTLSAGKERFKDSRFYPESRKKHYYSGGLRQLINRDLYQWMKEEVLSSPIKELNIIEPSYIDYLFEHDDTFKHHISTNHYGAIYTLSKFTKEHLV